MVANPSTKHIEMRLCFFHASKTAAGRRPSLCTTPHMCSGRNIAKPRTHDAKRWPGRTGWSVDCSLLVTICRYAGLPIFPFSGTMPSSHHTLTLRAGSHTVYRSVTLCDDARVVIAGPTDAIGASGVGSRAAAGHGRLLASTSWQRGHSHAPCGTRASRKCMCWMARFAPVHARSKVGGATHLTLRAALGWNSCRLMLVLEV